MKIVRTGASANHGSRKVELKVSKLRWNPTSTSFDVGFAGPATDFATDARHTYVLKFEAAEMANQVAWLADAAASMDPEDFTKIFGKALPSLFRLQAMASGLKLAS